MKNITLLTVVTIVFVMYLYMQETSKEPEQVTPLLNNISETTFSITENNIKYSNLYTEEVTVKKVIYNIIHPVIYTVIVELNTLIPLIIHVMSGEHASTIIKYLTAITIIWVIIKVPEIIQTIIAIYFFVKEKRKYKEKWWH